jgi:hypothetical protein
MKGYKSFSIFLLILLLAIYWIMPTCFGVDESEARSKISQAEQDLASAYGAVVEAELVGANVSGLKGKLDDAGELLAESYVAFRVGDYENASVLAVQCGNSVNGIVDDARHLKAETEAAYGSRLFLTSTLVSVGLSVLLILSLFGWRFLKNRYVRRVWAMKPEVGKAE